MLLIPGNEVDQYPIEMDAAYRLRHQVFVAEMGWEELAKPDGRETDQFDQDKALHMLLYEGKELIGYQRMLPTTGDYLLNSIYPHLCETELPNAPHVWEWTRFAVKKEHRKSGRKLSPAGNRLLSAIVEWGLSTGVDSIVIEMNPIWMLTLVQLHFRVHPLGIVHQLSGADTLAVTAYFDKRTLARLQELRGDEKPVLSLLQSNLSLA